MGQSGQDVWFVDAGKGVLDPLTSMNIIENLVNGTLKVHHRVSRDKVNWKALCNEPHFENLINHMINSMSKTLSKFIPESESSSPGETATEEDDFKNAGDIHSEISRQLADAARLTELSVNSNALRKILVAIAMQKKTVVKIQSEPSDEGHPDDASEYIIENEKARRFDLRHHPRLAALLVFCLLALAVQGGYRWHAANKEKARVAQVEQTKQDAVHARLMGDYDKALALVRQIPEKDLNNFDSKTLTEMAEVSLHKNDDVTTRKLCGVALGKSQDPVERGQLRSYMGMIDRKDGNLETAATQFQDSLNEDPDLYSSLHNLGIVYLDKNSLEPAETLFLKALSMDEKKEPVTLLALFETAMALEGPTADPSNSSAASPSSWASKTFDRLTKVDQMLEDFSQHSGALRAEILLARTRIAQVKKQPALVDKWMKQFVNLNPGTVKDRDLRTDLINDHVAWSHLYSWCLDAYSDAKTGAYNNALIAGCLLQTRSAKDALPYANFAYGNLPKDPLIKGLYAYILKESGQSENARQLLKNDKEESLSKLSLLTLARICDEAGEKECATKYFSKLYMTSPEDPSGQAWMAKMEFQKGDSKTAQKIIKAGLNRNPASKELQDTALKLNID